MARSRRLNDVIRSEPPVTPRVDRASTAVAVTRGHRPENPAGMKEHHPPKEPARDTPHSRAGRQRIRTFSHDDLDDVVLESEQAAEFLDRIRDQVALDEKLFASVIAFLTPTSGEPLLTHWDTG